MPYPRPKGQGGESLEGVGHNRSRKSTTFFPTGKILLLTASDFFGVAMPLAIWTSADYMLHRRLQCHQHVSDRTRQAHN